MTDVKQLAIDGSEPAFPEGPPTWPMLEPGVTAALARAASDGSWGRYHGEHCVKLQAALSKLHAVEHVTLVCSGTIAIELALRGLGVGSGDEVIVAAYDFPGNFRAIECTGATPVLVDIDANTWCLDAQQLEGAISPSTKALIVSHLHGGLADMATIDRIAKKHGVVIVEDACQSPGAMVGGRVAGTWGDMGVLSFGGSKLLSAGRGGAVFTNDAQAFQRIKVFANRGNDAFALSELQATVLLPQLELLGARNKQRANSAQRLSASLANVAEMTGVNSLVPDDQPAYYKVAWRYEPALKDPAMREQLIAAMATEGIAIDAGFRGFAGRSERRCRKSGNLDHAIAASQATILLHHPILLAEHETIDRLANAIRRVIRAVSNG
jgi:perosamine synthetase